MISLPGYARHPLRGRRLAAASMKVQRGCESSHLRRRRDLVGSSRAPRPRPCAPPTPRTPAPSQPHEEASHLLGSNPRRPRSAERVEDQLAFCRRGQDGAAQEAQGLLGWVAAVALLPHGHRREAPDGGDLGVWVVAVYEVVVEGVARSFAPARPQQDFVGVGARKLGQRLGWRSARRSRRAATWI